MSRNEKRFAHLAARDRNVVTIAVSPRHLQTVGLAREVADVYGLSSVGKGEIAMAKERTTDPARIKNFRHRLVIILLLEVACEHRG
jgi:hypothetical protein